MGKYTIPITVGAVVAMSGAMYVNSLLPHHPSNPVWNQTEIIQVNPDYAETAQKQKILSANGKYSSPRTVESIIQEAKQANAKSPSTDNAVKYNIEY